MNYAETLDYLFTRLPMFHRIGQAAYKADLTNTLLLCDLLDNPQNSFPSVHVTGTNGKGSVSHMLASICQESGLKTGLYTSPHLKDFRERIRINGRRIPEEKVMAFVNQHHEAFEKIGLSFFEMTVGMAFDYFRETQVDIAIIEVGLGGRLDSTNVITPLVSVITNVSFDHMQFLGNTLQSIGFEKAGIIKPGIPVIVGESQEETREVFTSKAEQTGSELLFADEHYALRNSRLEHVEGTLVRRMDLYMNNSIFLEDIKLPLAGKYQEKNIPTVLGACHFLSKKVNLPSGIIQKGLEKVVLNTGLTGRWQILSESPLTVCDTGHNEAGLREVLDQIGETPHKTLHFVFGVVNDKEIDKILRMLPRDATYYFCKADIPRGLDANLLMLKAREENLPGQAYPSVAEALAAARKNAATDDLVFVGGSTFVVAEVV